MKCKYCNAEIEQNVRFCPSCGAKQPHGETTEKAHSGKWMWAICVLLGIGVVIGGLFLYLGNKGVSQNNNGIAVADTSQVEETITQRLTEIYHDAFGDGNDCDSKYCSRSFVALMKEFDEAYENSTLQGELMAPDADHWIAAQDAVNPSMKIISISRQSDDMATATIHIDHGFENSGADVELKLVYENNDWFIDDFIILGRSERQVYEDDMKICKEHASH